jgi:hypothetical protein
MLYKTTKKDSYLTWPEYGVIEIEKDVIFTCVST